MSLTKEERLLPTFVVRVTAEDWVLVPIGSGNAEKEAFVKRFPMS